MLIRWTEWFAQESERLAKQQHPPASPWRAILSTCVQARPGPGAGLLAGRGVEIGASILAGVLADASVRKAICDLLASGLAQLDGQQHGQLKVLVVGIGDSTAMSLQREFATMLTLWHWNRGHGVRHLAKAGKGAGLVIAYRKPGDDARALLDRMGHRHLHQVDRIAHLRSTLLALAAMPDPAGDPRAGAGEPPARH